MSEGEYKFTTGFRLRDGVSAAAAIEDAFKGTTLAECEIALQLVFARGILKTIGAKSFDRAFGSEGGHNADLAVGFGDTAPQSRLKTLYEVKLLKDKGQLLPGDFVYFHNPADYLNQPERGIWRGENTVFLGNDRFSGHGVERLAENQLNEKLYLAYDHARGRGSARRVTEDQWQAMTASDGKPVGLSLSVVRPRIDRIQALQIPPLR